METIKVYMDVFAYLCLLVCVCMSVRACVNGCVGVHVCGCVDGSWEADTVQESHPLATDLFGRWRFQSNSHPASQWPWPPNISITSSSTDLPQPVTQERGKERYTLTHYSRGPRCDS